MVWGGVLVSSFTHMNGACNSTKKNFGPTPWGGVKGQISLNLNNKVIFKDFYSKLCVCSFLQIEDMNHIKQDFCSDA